MKRRQSIGLALAGLGLLFSAGCGSSNPDPAPQLEVALKLRNASATPAEASGAAAAAPTGTGWGTIRGKFVVDSAPPAPAALKIDKDVDVCGKHALVDQSLVVNPADKGLANVVLFVRNKNVRVNPEAEAALPKDVLLDNKGCQFEPHVVAYWAGKQNLNVKNSDPVAHNTNISPPGETGINPLLPPEAVQAVSFRRPQNDGVAATCNIHPWMKGYIVIRDNPYFAVTGPDGSFELKNVPAGEELEVEVWHERASGGVTVADGKVKPTKSRFKITVPENGVEDLGTLVVPLSALQ